MGNFSQSINPSSLPTESSGPNKENKEESQTLSSTPLPSKINSAIGDTNLTSTISTPLSKMLPNDINENDTQTLNNSDNKLAYSGSYSYLMQSENCYPSTQNSSRRILSPLITHSMKLDPETLDPFTQQNNVLPPQWGSSQVPNSNIKESTYNEEGSGEFWLDPSGTVRNNSDSYLYRNFVTGNEIQENVAVGSLFQSPPKNRDSEIFSKTLLPGGDGSIMSTSVYRDHYVTSRPHSAEAAPCHLVAANGLQNGVTQLLLGYEQNVPNISNNNKDLGPFQSGIRRSVDSNGLKRAKPEAHSNVFSDDRLTQMSVRALNQHLRGHRYEM